MPFISKSLEIIRTYQRIWVQYVKKLWTLADIFPFFTKYLTEINFVNNLIQMQHFATLKGCEELFQIFFHTWKKKNTILNFAKLSKIIFAKLSLNFTKTSYYFGKIYYLCKTCFEGTGSFPRKNDFIDKNTQILQ